MYLAREIRVLPIGSVFFLIFFFYFSSPFHASAAVKKPLLSDLLPPGPELLLTWKAQNYTPVMYPGKAIPTGKTPIVLSVELIDAGKVVDLSQIRVNWYVNNEFLDGGAGKHSIIVQTKRLAGDRLIVRADIPQYHNGTFSKSADIRSIAPVLTIVPVFGYDGNFITDAKSQFRAVPFFFNVTSPNALIYQWQVNDQEAQSTENPQLLNLSLPDTTPDRYSISVQATARDPMVDTLFSSAGATSIFTFIR